MTTSQFLQEKIDDELTLIASYSNSDDMVDILTLRLSQNQLKHYQDALIAVQTIENILDN